MVQEDNNVFFEVANDISEGTELLVWYGDSYLKYMGIPITMKEKISPQMLSSLGKASYLLFLQILCTRMYRLLVHQTREGMHKVVQNDFFQTKK